MNSGGPVDLLVLGAGMAGLSAATRALHMGLSVVVVEKGDAVGGSANYAGFIWTAPSLEIMHEINPSKTPELSGKIVNDFTPALNWVRSLGVDVGDPVTVLRFGKGCQTDMATFFSLARKALNRQGELLLNTQVERLIFDGIAVRGAVVRDVAGEHRSIEARYTLLATGGYGGSAELRRERIHPRAEKIPLRANPFSTGDGLRLGQAVGADSGPSNAGFYGHLVPAGIDYDDPAEFVRLTLYHSEHSLLFNLEARRFCDETVGDHLSTLAVLEQPEARALMICDQRVHREWMLTPYVEGTATNDRFQLAYRRGARCAVVDSIEDLVYLPEEWGYPGHAIASAVQRYNEQAGADTVPTRKHDQAPLVEPPYYVIEVVPAITYTFDGLRIDASARVLNGKGDCIPGLLAAGADAGGVYFRAYAGGLANALVFGLQAAETAGASA